MSERRDGCDEGEEHILEMCARCFANDFSDDIFPEDCDEILCPGCRIQFGYPKEFIWHPRRKF